MEVSLLHSFLLYMIPFRIHVPRTDVWSFCTCCRHWQFSYYLSRCFIINELQFFFFGASVGAVWNSSGCNVMVRQVLQFVAINDNTTNCSRRKAHSIPCDWRCRIHHSFRNTGEVWPPMNARDLLHRVIKITGNSGSDPRVMILHLSLTNYPALFCKLYLYM